MRIDGTYVPFWATLFAGISGGVFSLKVPQATSQSPKQLDFVSPLVKDPTAPTQRVIVTWAVSH